MHFPVDLDDYVSILAYVRMLGRKLEPVIRNEIPALLGHRTPSGLLRVADAASMGRLHSGHPREMLSVIVQACDRAIEDGASISGDWVEVGWSDGGIDWAWRETEVLSDEARCLLPLRCAFKEIVDLLNRIDDLVAAQRDIGEVHL